MEQQDTFEQLNELLDDQDQQKKTIQEARNILGESAESLSDKEVYDLVNEIQYLVDTWIDEYERKVFKGKTLAEVINV